MLEGGEERKVVVKKGRNQARKEGRKGKVGGRGRMERKE